ncbi:MAG: factor-independent urate hydroxylase [Planctomycetota bacterium]
MALPAFGDMVEGDNKLPTHAGEAMAARLAENSYGKHQVRFSKVRRPRQAAPKDERHELVEVCVDVELTGDFAAAYTDGDNRSVVATDTCKNTVYVVAKDDPLDSIESYGVALATHFIDRYEHVSECAVSLRETVWDRLNDCPHGFAARDRATPTATVHAKRGSAPVVHAGVADLVIAKTTESGFVDFHRDEFRTLADTDDRILATQMTAEWRYAEPTVDYPAARAAVVEALLARFLDHYSRSVQETLYFMGDAALAACVQAAAIELTMPNKHHLLANLGPFDRENDNEVFVVTDEPFGYINAKVTR